MANKNGQPQGVSSSGQWIWADDTTAVYNPAGVLMINPKDWQEFTEHAKAQCRPVRRRDSVTEVGMVSGAPLFAARLKR